MKINCLESLQTETIEDCWTYPFQTVFNSHEVNCLESLQTATIDARWDIPFQTVLNSHEDNCLGFHQTAKAVSDGIHSSCDI